MTYRQFKKECKKYFKEKYVLEKRSLVFRNDYYYRRYTCKFVFENNDFELRYNSREITNKKVDMMFDLGIHHFYETIQDALDKELK